ncbi:alpha/beta hydrolase [Novosphingobium resinovorum]
MLLFVHGGGFLVGDKGGDGNGNGGWANAHLGRWAAANGMLGAVMNYRLAPDETWPAGAEDVAAAVEWLQEHAAEHGGDPERIVLLGTSAGSVHIASFLKLRSDHAGMVRAAVLLSGLYGFTPLDERDMLYYGRQDAYAGRMPREAVVETALPCCSLVPSSIRRASRPSGPGFCRPGWTATAACRARTMPAATTITRWPCTSAPPTGGFPTKF